MAAVDLEIQTIIREHWEKYGISPKMRDELLAAKDLWSRKTFPYHVTGSVFLVNAETNKTLLLHHRASDKWLQPGGHLEHGESIIDAAMREVEEEVGIKLAHENFVPAITDKSLPISIDIHAIPERIEKKEPAHWHVDFRYIAYCGYDFVLDENEAHDAAWLDIDVIKTMDMRAYDSLSHGAFAGRKG